MRKNFKIKTFAWIIGMAMILGTTARAQESSWDPYVHSVIITPAPLLPLEFNGVGVCSLNPGNDGGTDLPLGNPAGTNALDLMVVSISLANGVPNVSDPSDATLALTALGGPGMDYWDWSYTPTNRTFRGVQNRIIPAYTAEQVTIQYRITENTFEAAAPTTYNGLNVNISPPGYTNPQKTDNDKASHYAFVEAKDYGDAPISYGEASHAIDLTKTGTSYNKYIYLGGRVDPETNYLASANADGDDTNQSGGLGVDDEDGVTFPAMVLGTTVTIPVNVTFAGGSFAFLNAWIDWNGDGDFGDTGEQIANNSIQFSSGTINLSVSIPAGATPGLTYARFRIAAEPAMSTGAVASGEVEDYQILLGPVTIGSYIWSDTNEDGIQDSIEPGLADIPVTLFRIENLGEGVLVTNEVATTTTDASGSYLFTTAPGTFFVRVDAPTSYTFSPLNEGQNSAKDSDFGRYTPYSSVFVLATGESELHLDAGLYYNPSPMLSVITSFSAYTRDGQVFVAWETAAEYDTMGYYIERLEGGSWNEINDGNFVGALGHNIPTVYKLIDLAASPGGTYTWRIIEVEGSGKENIYGPYTVTVDGPAADYNSWAAAINWNGAASGRDDDADGDGLTNFEEFLAGTDPLNANSVLKITAIKPVANGIEIRWSSVEGHVYSVEYMEKLGEAWIPVPSRTVATGPETHFVLPGADSGFFRVIMHGD